jgi:glycosyltransferase involved in cell wall biosynthesis
MSKLAIIVPLYNPHNDWYENICDSIWGLDLILYDIEYTLVIVNDGSSTLDESCIENLKARSNKIKYYSYPDNQGKGYALRFALSKVQSDFYVYTDIDFPFGFGIIKNMYQIYYISRTNLIIGIRDREYFNMLPLKRKLLSVTLHNINFVLTGFKVHDTQAGIKGFDNEGKKLFLQTKTNEFLFDLEFIHLCLRKKLKYLTIKVHPRPKIKFSEFSAKVVWREATNLIKILLRF